MGAAFSHHATGYIQSAQQVRLAMVQSIKARYVGIYITICMNVMRYLTIIIPQIHNRSEVEGDEPDESALKSESTYDINLLDDGTTVELSYIRGDPERLRDILESDPRVLAYDVVPRKSGGLVYIHSQATDLVTRLLTLLIRHKIIVDWPIEFTDRGEHRVTILGQDEQIRQMVNEIPNEIQVELEGMGDYQPDKRQLSSLLTDRQQQILGIAVEMGYYEIPRHTTLNELGEELDITAGTVGEHLRKIESKIILNHV